MPCLHDIQAHHVINLQHEVHDPTKETHPQKQIVIVGIKVQVTEICIFMCLDSSKNPFICWCSLSLLIHTFTPGDLHLIAWVQILVLCLLAL